MVFLYIVQCADSTLYTGISRDIQTRIAQHNKSRGAKYTKGRNPVILKYTETFATVSEALKREREIKRFSRKKKLALIQ